MSSKLGLFGVSIGRQLLLSQCKFPPSARNVCPLISRKYFSTDNKPAYTSEYFSRVSMHIKHSLCFYHLFFSQLVKKKPLVVFMKGDPSAPMVGKYVVQKA